MTSPPEPSPGTTGGQTGIVVTTKSGVAFLLNLFNTKLHLDDGPPVERPWGDTFIPTTPGRHVVRCYCPYLFYRYMGDSSVPVDVPPGGVVHVSWRAPWLAFLGGKWTFPSPEEQR